MTNKTLPAQLATQACDFHNPTINLEDVAWGLSRISRYNGGGWYLRYSAAHAVASSLAGTTHLKHMQNSTYTVAQHSVLLFKYGVRNGWSDDALWFALMHDAPEVIYGDITKATQEFDKEFFSEFFQGLPAPELESIQESTQQRYAPINVAVLEGLGCEPLSRSDYKTVMEADRRIVADEFEAFGWGWPEGFDKPEPLGLLDDIEPLTCGQAHDLYARTAMAQQERMESKANG